MYQWVHQTICFPYRLICIYLCHTEIQPGKSEGFDSCDRPSNLTQIGFKWSIFQPLWPCNLMDDPTKQHFKLFASFRSHWWIQTGVTVWKRLILIKIDDFEPCDLGVWRMTLKNIRAPHLCYFKLCASFRRHWWIETGVTVRKRLIWVKIDFFSRVTLKFGVWHWKTIGHLFQATSSFVHHFVAIGEFKLESQSENAQFRSN